MKKTSYALRPAVLLLLALAAAPAAAQDKADRARIDDLARDAARKYAAARAAGVDSAPADPAGQTRPNPALTPPPGTTVELTMDDAVMHALEQNTDIAVERLNPQVQDISISRIRANYLPTVSSTLLDRSQVNPPTSQLNGGTIVTNDTATYNAGVAQNIPWGGGNYSVSFNNQKVSTNNLFANFNPSFTSNLVAQVTQPLLRGLTIDTNRQQLRITYLNRDISDAQLRGVVATTVANVRNSYWELLYANQAVDVAKQSLSLAEQLVKDNEARVEVGTMAPLDVVQSRSEAAARRQAVAQAEAVLKTAELALKRLIVNGTQDPLWNAHLTPVDRPTFTPQPPDIEAAVRLALQNRSDLEAARKTVEQNDVTLKLLHNQTLPEVDAIALYQSQGLGGTQFIRGTGLGSPILSTIPGGFGDALTTLFNRAYPIWQVGVNVTYPIGGSAQDASYARGKVQRNQAAAQMRALELSVATEVTNNALLITSGQENYQAAVAARELAEQQLMAEQSRFEVGLSTNFLVVQAQRDLQNAQITELRALLTYREAMVNFERSQSAPNVRGGNTVQQISGPGF